MITLVEGMLGVGDGKSWIMSNVLLPEFLRNSKKHVYTTLPCDGDELQWLLSWIYPGKPVAQQEARERLHFLYPGKAEAWGEFWERPIPKPEFELLRIEAQAGDIPPVESVGAVEDAEGMVWVRVPWPTSEAMRQQYTHWGCRKIRKSLGQKDRLAEFWHFCPAGSVIIIDEAADVFGSGEYNEKEVKERRKVFKAYLRQHRHYIQDLYFACQDRADIDVEMRRLCQCVIKCRNLKKVPLIPGAWWARGLRWPVQVFEARHFLATQVINKNNEQVLVIEALEAFKYWPNKRSFKNYRSFSEASALKGKAPAEEGMHSADMDTPWDRIKGVLRGLGTTIGVAGGACVGVYLFIQLLYGMCGVNQTWVSRKLYGNMFQPANKQIPLYAKTSSTTNVVPVVSGTNLVATATNSLAVAAGVATNLPARLVLVTSERLELSDGTICRFGDEFPGRGRVCSWDQRGCVFRGADGLQFVSFGVLFRGARSGSGGSGTINERVLQSVDTARSALRAP